MLERLKEYFSISAERSKEREELRDIYLLDQYDDQFGNRFDSETEVRKAIFRTPIIVCVSGLNAFGTLALTGLYNVYAAEAAANTVPVLSPAASIAINTAPWVLMGLALWGNKATEKMHSAFVEIDRQKEFPGLRRPDDKEIDWNALREKRDAMRAVTPES